MSQVIGLVNLAKVVFLLIELILVAGEDEVNWHMIMFINHEVEHLRRNKDYSIV